MPDYKQHNINENKENYSHISNQAIKKSRIILLLAILSVTDYHISSYSIIT